MQISSGLEVIISFFGYTEFGLLEFSRVDFTEFSVLEFFWNRQNPLFFSIGSARIIRAFYLFFNTWLEVAVPVSSFIYFLVDPVSFYFLVNPVPFIF